MLIAFRLTADDFQIEGTVVVCPGTAFYSKKEGKILSRLLIDKSFIEWELVVFLLRNSNNNIHIRDLRWSDRGPKLEPIPARGWKSGLFTFKVLVRARTKLFSKGSGRAGVKSFFQAESGLVSLLVFTTQSFRFYFRPSPYDNHFLDVIWSIQTSV